MQRQQFTYIFVVFFGLTQNLSLLIRNYHRFLVSFDRFNLTNSFWIILNKNNVSRFTMRLLISIATLILMSFITDTLFQLVRNGTENLNLRRFRHHTRRFNVILFLLNTYFSSNFISTLQMTPKQNKKKSEMSHHPFPFPFVTV